MPAPEGWDLLASLVAEDGTTYDIYIPPLMSFDEPGTRSVFQSIKIINRTTGKEIREEVEEEKLQRIEKIKALGLTIKERDKEIRKVEEEEFDFFGQLADWDIDYESVAQAASYGVFEKALKNRGLPEGYLDLPDIRDYLLNQSTLALQGVLPDLESILGLANQMATDTEFAARMRRAGLMGEEAARKAPPLGKVEKEIIPPLANRPGGEPSRILEPSEQVAFGREEVQRKSEAKTRLSIMLAKAEGAGDTALADVLRQALERQQTEFGIAKQSLEISAKEAEAAVKGATVEGGIEAPFKPAPVKTPEQLAREAEEREINRRFREMSQRRTQVLRL